ncbi:MAG: hypothetical protein HY286_07905 [Planctomycetes bacterium]|nr:hypothetical protein [Planctomycetota bacterium]
MKYFREQCSNHVEIMSKNVRNIEQVWDGLVESEPNSPAYNLYSEVLRGWIDLGGRFDDRLLQQISDDRNWISTLEKVNCVFTNLTRKEMRRVAPVFVKRLLDLGKNNKDDGAHELSVIIRQLRPECSDLIPQLVETPKITNARWTAQFTAGGLASIGQAAVPAIASAFDEAPVGSHWERNLWIYLSIDANDYIHLDFIKEWLSGDDKPRILKAVRAVANAYDRPELYPLLADCFERNDDADIRYWIIYASRFRRGGVETLLIHALNDKSAKLRAAAAESIYCNHEPCAAAAPALGAAALDADRNVRIWSIIALWKLGPLAASEMPQLAIARAKAEAFEKAWIDLAIESIQPKPAWKLLPEQEIAKSAKLNEAPRDSFVNIESANVRQRGEAAVAIARSAAIRSLETALKSNQPAERESAAKSLLKIEGALIEYFVYLIKQLNIESKDIWGEFGEGSKYPPLIASFGKAVVPALQGDYASGRFPIGPSTFSAHSVTFKMLGTLALPAVMRSLQHGLWFYNNDDCLRLLADIGPPARMAMPLVLSLWRTRGFEDYPNTSPAIGLETGGFWVNGKSSIGSQLWSDKLQKEIAPAPDGFHSYFWPRIGKDAIPFLKDALDDPHELVRKHAAKALKIFEK